MFILKYILIFIIGTYNLCYNATIYDLDFFLVLGQISILIDYLECCNYY